MFLSDTARSLKVVLAGAVNSDQPEVKVSYEDIVHNLGDKVVPGETQTTTHDATAVSVCAAPAEVTTRKVTDFCLYNMDDASVVASVLMVGGDVADHVITKVTLATLESLCWTPARGWHVLTVAGLLRETI